MRSTLHQEEEEVILAVHDYWILYPISAAVQKGKTNHQKSRMSRLKGAPGIWPTGTGKGGYGRFSSVAILRGNTFCGGGGGFTRGELGSARGYEKKKEGETDATSSKREVQSMGMQVLKIYLKSIELESKIHSGTNSVG